MLYVIGFLVISIVAIRLNMKYYKLKGQALLRLAFILKIEVYKKNHRQAEVKSA